MTRSSARATLVDRRDLSPTLGIFRRRPEGGVAVFLAGWFLTLGLTDLPLPDETCWRAVNPVWFAGMP